MNTIRKIRRNANPLAQRQADIARVVNARNATELHDKLVADACSGHPTDVQFAILAYQRIAKLRRQPLDDAFKAVEAEVRHRRSGLGMPL